MINFDNSLRSRLGILVVVALIAAAALPASAGAQDPAGDQYAPATPNGGGHYNFGSSGTPAPSEGTGSRHGSSSSGGASSTTGGGAVSPNDVTESGGAPAGNRDQRIVTQLAAEGVQARADDEAASRTSQPRLSSDASASGGLGALFWTLLAATLLWAIVIGVVNYRHRTAGAAARPPRRGGAGNGRQPI